MNEYEIWEEGYIIQGGSGTASLIGKYSANDFDGAVEKMLEQKEKESPGYREKYYYTWVQQGRRIHRIWGCRLFDNEKDARKSFG